MDQFFDPSGAIGTAAREAFDISYLKDDVRQEVQSVAFEMMRPSVLFRPVLTVDGNLFCALYGADLMQGCAGFGETPDAAMRDFDKNWTGQKVPGLAVAA
jgi:hypothetical protein